MIRRILTAGALSATLVACAPVAPPPPPGAMAAATTGRQCFFPSTVSGFREGADRRTAYLRVSGREVYQVDLFAPCPDLASAERILLDSRGGGASVCTGLDVTLIVPGPIGPQRCPATSLRRLAETEVEALPARYRP
jgi:hypothetical protein